MFNNQIEDVFFNLVIKDKTLDINVAYTFLPESLDEKIKLNKKLNFKKEITDKNINDIKLLFNIVVPNINVDFEGTESLRKANKETMALIKETVIKLNQALRDC